MKIDKKWLGPASLFLGFLGFIISAAQDKVNQQELDNKLDERDEKLRKEFRALSSKEN